MNFIFDLVFVTLLVICIIDGRRKGFIKIGLSFAAMLIAWIVASEFSRPVAEWANEAFAGEWIIKVLEGAIANSVSNGADSLFVSIPEPITNVLEVAGVSLEDLASQLGNTIDPAIAAEKFYSALENNIFISILILISFFGLYLVVNLVASFATRIINKMFKLPILKSVNRLLGAVFGGMKGVIIVTIISIVLRLTAMVIPDTPFAQALEQSVVHGIISDVTQVIYGS